jgi:hypothetical protein
VGVRRLLTIDVARAAIMNAPLVERTVRLETKMDPIVEALSDLKSILRSESP